MVTSTSLPPGQLYGLLPADLSNVVAAAVVAAVSVAAWALVNRP